MVDFGAQMTTVSMLASCASISVNMAIKKTADGKEFDADMGSFFRRIYIEGCCIVAMETLCTFTRQ